MHSCGSFWHDVPVWILTAFPFLGAAYYKARAWLMSLRALPR